MWYYYGLVLKKYVSLSYDELPLVHYNAPGPKPWAAQAVSARGAAVPLDPRVLPRWARSPGRPAFGPRR
jgi:hypothetical protein